MIRCSFPISYHIERVIDIMAFVSTWFGYTEDLRLMLSQASFEALDSIYDNLRRVSVFGAVDYVPFVYRASPVEHAEWVAKELEKIRDIIATNK